MKDVCKHLLFLWVTQTTTVLYSQVQLGFSSQVFPYSPSLENSNLLLLLLCSQWELCAINLCTCQNTALLGSEGVWDPFLLFVCGYLEGQYRGRDNSRLERRIENLEGLEYWPGLSILDCSLWNSIEYIMEIVLGTGLRHQTYLLPPLKLLSLLNSLNLEGLLPSEST